MNVQTTYQSVAKKITDKRKAKNSPVVILKREYW